MTCDRFEKEGLPLIEQGLPLPEHFATCEECQRARAEYERLKEIVRASVEESQPSPDWKDRVRRRIAEDTSPRRRSLVPLAAAAAVVLVFGVFLWRSAQSGLAPGVLDVEVVRGGVRTRGGGLASPGDVLTLAATSDAPELELRVYFNDTDVVLRCSDAAPCSRRGDAVVAEVRMDRRGVYQSVLLVSQTALPPPQGSLDEDSGSALAAGGRVTLGSTVAVR